MSVTISGSNVDYTQSITQPTFGGFVDGGSEFVSPPAVAISFSNVDYSESLGVSASGRVRRADSFVPGRVSLKDHSGTVFAVKELTKAGYTVSGAPDSVISGQTTTRSSFTAIFNSETGATSNKTFNGRSTNFSVNFGSLTVVVQDVDGNPVESDRVVIAGSAQFTDPQGQVSIAANSGDDVVALKNSRSKPITVSGGGSQTITFTYSGINGEIDTPGGPVAGSLVEIKDSDGNTIDTQTSDNAGGYNFSTIPVSSDIEIEAGQFTRSVTSGSEGQDLTKNVPIASDIGAVNVFASDTDTGERAQGVDATLGQLTSRTDPNGQTSVIGAAPQQVQVTVADNDRRYYAKTVTVDLGVGDSTDERLDLVRKYNPSNY